MTDTLAGTTPDDSKLIQRDPTTETTYTAVGFNPATSNNVLNRTSSRVLKPVYNRYAQDTTKPKVFGYYTNWSQYDRRLDNNPDPQQAGRGYDLGKVDPLAYDKLIFGSLGIVGDRGPKGEAIHAAARAMLKKEDEVTVIDLWGAIAAWRNNGFTQAEWRDRQGERIGQNGVYEPFMHQSKLEAGQAFGLLGGLYGLQKRAAGQGHKLELAFSVGGWTMSGMFSRIAASPARRAVFVASIIDVFKRFPMFSEVDIDWEYPGGGGLEDFSSEADGPNYALLIGELRGALDAQFSGANRKRISIAASGVPAKMAKSNIPGLFAAGLDSINVMTYDFFGSPWAPKLAHHTTLWSSDADLSAFSVAESVAYLATNLGVSPHEINIGFASYGRSAQNADLASLSPLIGSYRPDGHVTLGTFESGTTEWSDVLYNYLDLERQTGRNGYSVYTDAQSNADYLYNSVSRVFISLDTPRTVAAKARYATEHKLGGMFMWTADLDSGLLVNAAREGAGYELITRTIDMSGFYFHGENMRPVAR